VALAFCAAGTKEDQALIDGILMAEPPSRFAEVWLREKGLDWAADLIANPKRAVEEVA
jgi:hypothetical protein